MREDLTIIVKIWDQMPDAQKKQLALFLTHVLLSLKTKEASKLHIQKYILLIWAEMP